MSDDCTWRSVCVCVLNMCVCVCLCARVRARLINNNRTVTVPTRDEHASRCEEAWKLGSRQGQRVRVGTRGARSCTPRDDGH